MKILHLNLKKKWFDMILSGEKTEEYREIKQYWTTRLKDFLVKKSFDCVVFRNGYGYKSPSFKIELISIDFGVSKKEWSGKEEYCYVLKLGEIIL